MIRAAKGFTLLEILVTISLMVVLMGLFVVQISGSNNKEVFEQATQFKRQFQIAYSNAQFQQKTIILLIHPQDYSFIELVIPKKPGETLSFKNYQPFKKNKSGADVFYTLDAKEGFDWFESVFASVFDLVQEQLGEPELVFIMPSGHVTPEFEISIQGYEDAYLLRYIGQGQFTDETNEG